MTTDTPTPEPTPLWAIRVSAITNLYAAPSQAEAERVAAYLDDILGASVGMRFHAARWSHSAEEHAANLARFWPGFERLIR